MKDEKGNFLTGEAKWRAAGQAQEKEREEAQALKDASALIDKIKSEVGAITKSDGKPATLQTALDLLKSPDDKLKFAALNTGKEGRMPNLKTAVKAGVVDYAMLKSLHQYEEQSLKAVENKAFRLNTKAALRTGKDKIEGKVQKAIIKELEKKQSTLKSLLSQLSGRLTAANYDKSEAYYKDMEKLCTSFERRIGRSIGQLKKDDKALSGETKKAKARVTSTVAKLEEESMKIKERLKNGEAMGVIGGKLLCGKVKDLEAKAAKPHGRGPNAASAAKGYSAFVNTGQTISMISDAIAKIGSKLSKTVESLLAKLTSKGKGGERER